MKKIKKKELKSLEKKIDYLFAAPLLLEQALTHRSIKTELGDYERLEFLGDSIVGFVVASELYKRFPQSSEGTLSKLKAELVSGKNLAKIAKKEGFGAYLRLNIGENKNASFLADIFESIIGAVYCDGGFTPASSLVRRLLNDSIQETKGIGGKKDYKSLLQIVCQKLYQKPPTYKIVKTSGPDHKPFFTAVVAIQNQQHGDGEGRTKKAAEQVAAKMALENIETEQQ